MASARSQPPAESDLLCEYCGYILNGLESTPATACPECGHELAASVEPGHRRPALIESAGRRGFWRTTWAVILRKRKFFRETLTRPTSAGMNEASVSRFGIVHRIIAGTLFGLAATVHLAWMAETRGWTYRWTPAQIAILCAVGVVIVALSVVGMMLVTRLAIRLTATESRFWGMRLPLPVVRRALDFHAANYLPIGVLAFTLTAGYRICLATGLLTAVVGVPYLVALSAAVVAGAIWLFESYVIAMRRIRYANF